MLCSHIGFDTSHFAVALTLLETSWGRPSFTRLIYLVFMRSESAGMHPMITHLMCLLGAGLVGGTRIAACNAHASPILHVLI